MLLKVMTVRRWCQQYRKMSVWAAAEKGDFVGVKTAVENGADIEEHGGVFPEGTGLHHACHKGHFSIADYLIRRGAKVNSRNKFGSLPIHYACIHGHLDTVKLVTKGNNFASTNNYGRTPLHFASFNGHTSVAQYLIECGAELNSTDKDGYMPMHLASIRGQLDTVVLLNIKGSDFTSTNNDGHTPRDLALVNGHTSVADYLILCGGEGAERQVKQRPPDRLRQEEIVLIAQRIPRIWKEVANLTKLFEDHEIDNIIYRGGGEDESHKARTMLKRYTERGGTRQTLVDALKNLKMTSLAENVFSGSFVRDQ